jgi:hypothetical protein
LARQLGEEPSEETRSRITSLPLAQLEDLSEALLEFEIPDDLETWLQQHQA